MKSAVIYARYSSEKQTEQSIEGQLRECNAYAERNDIVVVDTYIDRAMSGKTDQRKSLQKMLRDSSKRAWDMVLVYKLDRFSRNKYEMAMHRKTLRDNGIKLVSAMENIPDTPEGIILESLLEGMAEYYSAELAQKVRRGQRETRLKGNYAGGGVPYGYKVVNKHFVVQENEAQIVLRIFEEYAAGIYVKDIIKELTAEGIMHRTGKPFTKAMLYGILQNERYSGVYHHKTDGEFTNTFERIVPDALFKTVQAIVERNRYGKRSPDVVYLLRDKLICAYCGRSICSESGTSKSGNIARYYKCSSRKKERSCQKSVVRKEDLENLVIDTTLKVLDDVNTMDLIADKVFEANQKRIADNSVLGILECERHDLQKSLENMLKAMEQGIITASTKQRIEELEGKIETVDGKIVFEQSKSKMQLTKTDIKRFLNKALRKEPRQMIRLLVKKIVLFDDKIEIYYNYIDKKKPDDIDHQAFSIYREEIEYELKDWASREKRMKIKMLIELFF